MSGRHTTPYLRAGNITTEGLDLSEVREMDFTPAEREMYALRNGDLVLAEASGSSTHVGRPAVWRDELPLCCIQNTIIRFRPHATTSEYALVVFRHFVASGAFAQAARGIGLLHLGARRFGEMAFPLPPLPEQVRISAVVDSKLDELSQVQVALESALEGTGKQDREILAAAARGRLSVGSDVVQTDTARSRSPKSGGEDLTARVPIPVNWSWELVGSVGEVTLGKSLGPSSRQGANIRPYLRVANVLEDKIDVTDLKEMAFSDSELEKYALRDGDILLNDGQSIELVGRPAMYREILPELYFQNHLIRFRAGPLVDPHYALIVFRHYLHAGEFRRLARGSTNIANLSRARFASMPFPVPPLDEQRAIAAEAKRRLDASQDQRQAIVSSLDRGREMAAELLATAVTGQLVDQDSGDETAQQMLARLGPPRPTKGKRVPRRPTKRKVPTRAANGPPLGLSAVLAEAGRPLTVLELCRAAEVDINDVDQIEHFYIALRDELGDSIRVVGDGGEATELEVVGVATP